MVGQAAAVGVGQEEALGQVVVEVVTDHLQVQAPTTPVVVVQVGQQEMATHMAAAWTEALGPRLAEQQQQEEAPISSHWAHAPSVVGC